MSTQEELDKFAKNTKRKPKKLKESKKCPKQFEYKFHTDYLKKKRK